MSHTLQRLAEERKSWRKDHPAGFWAKPQRNPDGSTNMFVWQAGIPGKEDTPWEGGTYIVKLIFTEDYPSTPPNVVFTPVLFHPNIFPSGKVCLSILNEDKDWRPTITLKQILTGVQELLANPNPLDPAQQQPNELFVRDRALYEKKVRSLALKYRST